jgi:multidrug efflux pump
MTIGTIFTLFVLPALYILFAKDHRAEQSEPAAAGAPVHEPALAK